MKLTALAVALVFAAFSTGVGYSGPLELKPEYKPALMKNRPKVIDPDKSVYGVPFGASEAQLVAAFGDPNGLIVVSDSAKAFLYGSTHLFLFKSGKLRELIVGHSVIDWQLSQRMDGNPFFDAGGWTMAPGIQNEMTFEQVQKVLRKPSAVPDHQYSYETDNAVVELMFSSMSGPGTDNTKYRLFGFNVRNYGN
ncbi:MAG: hypothetical protein WD944_08205 [Steroidobacteraceae bacterium]